MLMTWICYFINHHFKLVDHQGSNCEREKKKITDEKQREIVCVHTSLCMHACRHMC